jgi:YEATS domain-containing protein 4
VRFLLFILTVCSWGEFDIAIRLTFTQESGEKPFTFYHHLKLHPWRLDPVPELPTDPEAMIKREQQELEEARRLGPVHSWQYDEIVFNDPFQGFLNTLMAHPPTPLPRTRSRPVPFHTANPTKEDLHLSRGGVPEFTQEMEILEARRLDEATNAVAEEQNRWQAILEDKEAELATLRAQLGDEL